MKDAEIAVPLEIPVSEVWGMTPDETATYVLRIARTAAQRAAERDGGRLVETAPPVEVTVQKGTHTLLGVECLLVFTRWRAVAPERVELDTGRPA